MNEQFPPYLSELWMAFMIWMFIDAWRRRAPAYWYFVIMMPPGALLYFVAIKLRDLQYDHTPTSERTVAETPSTAPGSRREFIATLDDADRLEDEGRYSEAEPIYRQALTADPSDPRALFGLGNCHLGLGNAAESLPCFEQLMEIDRGYANFGAALNYADALWAANQRSDCTELLERLAEVTGRINHRVALAHYLAEMGQTERAKRELERAIEEGQGPNAPYNERQRRWVDAARQMHAELSRAPESADPDDDRDE